MYECMRVNVAAYFYKLTEHIHIYAFYRHTLAYIHTGLGHFPRTFPPPRTFPSGEKCK